VQVLNEFFAAYRNSHSQGGTSTRQRNLHHLFKWLALRYGHPDPWTGEVFPQVCQRCGWAAVTAGR
jgi:hypothetical protein